VYDHPFVTRVDELEEDSDLIIIFGGTNDFGHGDAPLGDMSSRSNKTFYGALHNLYRAVINRFHDKKIIVLTPTHRRNEENICAEANQRPFPTAPLKGYVDIIKEVAQYYSLPVLDLFSVSGMQPDVDIIREKYMPDGLRPSDLGHEGLADLIAAFIKTL
ncbi:MAG: SGNH/GDSL hydrolase family protein, partial [Oscillospiraceae bacterium]|nr:SGNH/GDSL hydrolase family protein [Candidatus Equicaccousia limihippi]